MKTLKELKDYIDANVQKYGDEARVEGLTLSKNNQGESYFTIQINDDDIIAMRNEAVG